VDDKRGTVHPPHRSRRDFLRAAATLAASAAVGRRVPPADARPPDESPEVAHLIPTASHDRILVKVSFTSARAETPVLRVGRRRVAGTPTDTGGRFFAFDVPDVAPGRRHRLELFSGTRRLLGPWPLSTFPAPNARPRHCRLLVYTCAGGNDLFPLYVPAPLRRRLLQRGLAFRPDAVVAIGDHVYWDLRAGPSALVTGASPIARERVGTFDLAAPALGGPNEDVLKGAVDPQIAGLYGTLLRSTPAFFLRDDHDYFEDDRVTPGFTSFPPDRIMRDLARASQWLWYPEFLPDRGRPATLPGASAADRPPGVSEAFGTLRYGRLLEALLYDCKGFMSVGARATLVPPAAEEWLLARMADRDAAHVVNVPSNPVGFTAGKYAEWYPDLVGDDGRLTTAEPKPGWQPGWQDQHDRILAAASRMRRVPLFLSGDIHGHAEGRILGTRGTDLRRNPIVSIITGTPGTGIGWPSIARRTRALPPLDLEVEVTMPAEEVNGFHLVDVTPERIVVRHFRWRYRTDPESAIDRLRPFRTSVFRRGLRPAT
jgi:hypothetical protein